MNAKNLYKGRFLGLVEENNWEYATRVNASAVVVLIPLTPEGKLLFVEQYRQPLDCIVVEFPAGLVGDQEDPDESLATAALRELEEETGYSAGKISELITCPSSAGMTDETITFFLATELVKTGPGGGDDSEDITVFEVAISDADDWLASRLNAGRMADPKIWSVLYWLDRIHSGKDAIPGISLE